MALLPYSHTIGMVCHMVTKKTKKTTLNIDETVMRRLKEEAARRGETMSSLVEAAVRQMLPPPAFSRERPIPTHDFGETLVDIASREALYQVMNQSDSSSKDA